MRSYTKKAILLASCLALALALASCAPKKAPAPSQVPVSTAPAQESPSPVPETVVPETEAPEGDTSTKEATVNLADADLGLLVLVDDDGYYRLDVKDVDLSALTPGDSVRVTYTGTLTADSDDITATLVSVEKLG